MRPIMMGKPSCPARASSLAIWTRDRACRVSPSRRVNKLNMQLETEGGFTSKSVMVVTSVVDDLVEHSVSKFEEKLDATAKDIKEIKEATADTKQQIIVSLGILGAVLFLKPQSWDLVALLGTLAGLFK